VGVEEKRRSTHLEEVFEALGERYEAHLARHVAGVASRAVLIEEAELA
jgi:hypothetical protein